MKAIILVRVSTQLQDFEQQKKKLIQYANSKGFNEPFLIDKKKRKLYIKNDFNRWEEYDYEYTIRYIPRK